MYCTSPVTSLAGPRPPQGGLCFFCVLVPVVKTNVYVDGFNLYHRDLMMTRACLPRDSRQFSELAFKAKEQLRKRRARMSYTRKIASLSRMLEMRSKVPDLRDNSGYDE